jgi:hypothetical protein
VSSISTSRQPKGWRICPVLLPRTPDVEDEELVAEELQRLNTGMRTLARSLLEVY